MAINQLDARQQQNVGDTPILSRLDGSIERLAFLERALLFAELSSIAYMDRADAGLAANQIGLPEIRFYDRDGAQAYIFGGEHDAVVACRGTEPEEWNDVRADLDAATAVAETVGRVHRGFKREVDDLWPRLERALVSNSRTLWFTGHSLGGAMTTICAGRCKLSHIRSDPRAVFTYGSPRVGNRRYVNFVKLEFYRFVNNNDIVTRVPPSWMGYRHTGQEVYFDNLGRIRRVSGWRRTIDRLSGFMRGLTRGQIDQVSDHSLAQYIKHIARAMEGGGDPRSRVLVPGVRIDSAQPLRGPAAEVRGRSAVEHDT